MGVGGQRHASAAFTPGKDPVHIVQEADVMPKLRQMVQHKFLMKYGEKVILV